MIFTNGTVRPKEKFVDILNKCKDVRIFFSIDDIEQRFEYQRSNAVWTEVNDNIQRFRELRDRSSNIQLQCCSTVNVFNVFYLADLANWIDLQDFDFVYWNMMHEAYYFSINTLPDTAKHAISQRLQSANVSHKNRQEFVRIVDFMNNGASMDGFILKMKVADLDRKRQQNLHITQPEFAQLIDYAGPDQTT